MSNKISIIVAGKSGVGKTVIMQEIYTLLREKGYVVGEHDLEHPFRHPVDHQMAYDNVLQKTDIDIFEMQVYDTVDGEKVMGGSYLNKVKEAAISWFSLIGKNVHK